ncbi:hypothetical protein LHL18_05905 [Rheinheimera aquimaris]|nr:hypothetical protein [Rheinheimera aquimaris]MCB5213015.1 hypothetical protein [Rheinheimera aquimaris]
MIWLNYRLKMLSPLHCQSWLTDTEWQYAQTLSEKRARQFCNGRALVRKMLQHIQATGTNDIAISLPSDKAPTLIVGVKHWYLSLSHSKEAIAAAISVNEKIGLDIEQIKPRQFKQLQQGHTALQHAPDLNTFYQQWTLAEAYSKYSGNALLGVLRHGISGKIRHKHFPLPGYMLCLVHQNNDTEITLCEDDGIPPCSIRNNIKAPG